MGQANLDVGVFQDTKMTDRIYTRGLSGYRVVAALAPSQHRRGFMLLYLDSPNFSVKAIHQFGANVIMCQLATWERR